MLNGSGFERFSGLVGEEGLEPSRPCGQQILSLPCIPISSLARVGERVYYTIQLLPTEGFDGDGVDGDTPDGDDADLGEDADERIIFGDDEADAVYDWREGDEAHDVLDEIWHEELREEDAGEEHHREHDEVG